ncbi:MAG: ABC transporter permease [Gammaproteobacteria bacterium]|nr:ABC transporter permease [Gammaproteobacteria bacterium]
MNQALNFFGVYTLFRKEILRFSKVWLQTIGAPIVTSLLYLLVFGHVLEDRVQVFEGVSYTAFLIPGLMMMSVIQNAFANSSSSLIQSKVTGNIVFILLTPLSHLEMYLAFVAAAVMRGLLVGAGVCVVAVVFIDLPIAHPFLVLVFALAGSAVLGSLGVIAGIWADKFDQLAGFQNFVIMPLSFLSGVFYSIKSLPGFWQQLSHFNPFFYMIDGFRYGFFGVSDVSPWTSLAVVLIVWLALALATLAMLARGYKLRS